MERSRGLRRDTTGKKLFFMLHVDALLNQNAFRNVYRAVIIVPQKAIFMDFVKFVNKIKTFIEVHFLIFTMSTQHMIPPLSF